MTWLAIGGIAAYLAVAVAALAAGRALGWFPFVRGTLEPISSLYHPNHWVVSEERIRLSLNRDHAPYRPM